MSIPKRTMYFIDGENLVLRYQEGLKEGRTPVEGVVHVRDILAWTRNIIYESPYQDVVRATYYASAVGDDPYIEEIRKTIHQLTYYFKDGLSGTIAHIVPKVYKKPQKSNKSRAVDINITLDITVNTYNDSIDDIYLLSGDGDYLPVIEEAMRRGKHVYVYAFSNGLSPSLKNTADDTQLLDSFFFTN
jgi:uncharacterized LabA/DUF88 family protein